MDDRAVTTYSIDYMHLTEEDDAWERERERGGSTTLGRPTIVCVDRKTGRVHAHQVKCKGSDVKAHEPECAEFHDGISPGLRTKVIGTPSGVVKAKTVRRLPEDHRLSAEEGLSIRGIPSNFVLGVGKEHIHIKVSGSRHAERCADKHVPA